MTIVNTRSNQSSTRSFDDANCFFRVQRGPNYKSRWNKVKIFAAVVKPELLFYASVTHCLLFISQLIYLHNLSPHTSSLYLYWPIKSLTRVFKFFWEDYHSEDGFRTGCRNVSHEQQSFSGLQSPRWSFSIKVTLLLGSNHFLINEKNYK